MKNDPRIEAAQTELEAGVKALVSSEDWKRHLETQARFHRYSFQNVLWLAIQAAKREMPLSKVAGFNTWKDLGRFVKKGERALNVLAPMLGKKTDEETGEERRVIYGFKVVSVFDMSQTDGAELPEVCHDVDGNGEAYKALTDKLAAFSASRSVPVTFTDCGSAQGSFNRMDKAIKVRPEMGDLQTAATLVHEVAHSLLHTEEDDCHSRPEMEVEAESVAFVVMSALGMDVSRCSFGYVAGWSKGDTDLVKKTADRVQKAAKKILEAVE